ncbi:putative reverse transcriptase domain-containing protein [Tanacetum coccineum]
MRNLIFNIRRILNETGHYKDKCPKGRNQQDEGARARAYVMGTENPQKNPNVVTGTFLVNDHNASILFDSGAEKSFVSIEFTPFINIAHATLDTSYEVELADRKKPKDIRIIRDFPEVFLDNFLGLPLIREIEFRIDLILGLAGYYQRFIEKFSKITTPLTLLTQKNKTYVWGDKQEKDFRILKEKLCKAPVLARPDGPNDFMVYCNASNQGFGCVLMQRGKRWWIELLSDYECEIKYHPSKANVMADALSRKERLKPRRVCAMSMTIQSGLKANILGAQGEASKDLKAPTEWLRGLEIHFERRDDGGIYFFNWIWIPSVGGVRKLIMDEAHTTRITLAAENSGMEMGEDNNGLTRHGVPVSIILDHDGRFASHLWKALQKVLGTRLDKSTAYHPKPDGQSEHTIPTLEDMLRACIMDFGGSWDTHLPLETTEKIVQIKERLKTARSRQKSYADKRRKPLEFKVEDQVLLKVSPWKGAVQFGKKGKLAPRCIHNTFHVSNLKKCLAESYIQVPLEKIEIDENLYFVDEPIEIVARDVKKLKRRRIPLVKVRWNSRQGAGYTWEREDQFKTKYPHLFATSSSTSVASPKLLPFRCRQIVGLWHAIHQPSQASFPPTDSRLAVPSFLPSDDPIANDLDAFDSNCDEAPSTSDVLIAKLSAYDSDILLEVPTHDTYLDNQVIDQSVQVMQYSKQLVFDNDTNIEITSKSNIISYEQYLKETENAVVQNTSSFAQQDALMPVIEEMSNQIAKCNEVDKVIVDRNAKVADFQNQIHSLKLQLNATVESHKTLSTTVDVLKMEYKAKEDKYLEEIIGLEKKRKALDNAVYKMGHSTQTMHMLTKPQAF